MPRRAQGALRRAREHRVGAHSWRRRASTSSTGTRRSRRTPSASSSCAARATACATTSTSGPATTTRTTARLYTDFGLFTCDEQIGADVADMFNFLTGYARPRRYRKVLVAPELPARRDHRARSSATIAAHEAGQPGADRDEDELARRPALHRGAVPRLAGRRAGRPQHPRDLLPGARACRASRRTSASSRSSGASSSTRGSTPSSATARRRSTSARPT